MATFPFLGRFGGPARRAGAALILLLAPACGPKAEDANPAADSAAAVPADSAMANMPGMAMTGDADRDFLRMMSDHHKGLIAIAHESMEEGRGTPQSRTDARSVDAKQDEELEQMIKMLESNYQDSYQPRATPADLAVVDSMLKTAGPGYAMAFYHNVIDHHRRGLAMIDQYLPRAGRADVKTLAEQMRKAQLAEIQEFERKAGM